MVYGVLQLQNLKYEMHLMTPLNFGYGKDLCRKKAYCFYSRRYMLKINFRIQSFEGKLKIIIAMCLKVCGKTELSYKSMVRVISFREKLTGITVYLYS
jgi:hypothetical protein